MNANVKAKAVHAAQTLFPVENDCLLVGGIPLTRLAQRVGSTPFYAYDRRLLTQRVAQVRAHLPPAVELHFSMKANPMPALVQHMAGLVDGIDVASGGELKVALDTGIAPERISFAGPGKSEAELTRAVAAGAVVHAESERELRVLAFEREWTARSGDKDDAIRSQFGLSSARYYQVLGGLLSDPAALAYDPMLIKRLQRLREARARARSSRRL